MSSLRFSIEIQLHGLIDEGGDPFDAAVTSREDRPHRPSQLEAEPFNGLYWSLMPWPFIEFKILLENECQTSSCNP